MKKLLATMLVLSTFSCATTHKNMHSGNRMKARLEDKGMCSNYTFTMLEGNPGAGLTSKSWTNPQTHKTYKNAFAVSNPCNLPAGLKQGDEFYFEIANSQADCAVCMAYYPTPEKRLNIKVLQVIKK